MKKTILGVKIDDISMKGAVDVVESWLSKPGKHFIVTPNPEFLVTAQKDKHFKKILNDADLAIPDGVGLKLGGIKNTVAGTDLMERLCGLASEKGYKIGLLGGRERVAELCARRLTKKFPELKISFIKSDIEILNTGYLIPDTDLLFVAYGHGKQEKWIYHNLPSIQVKVAMGVGGAFDYISGNIPRAPIWMRKLDLEWLFRLAVQPWRIKRQLALLKYIWLLIHSTHSINTQGRTE